MSHEQRDVDVRRVAWAAGGVLGLLLVAVVLSWVLLGSLERWRVATSPPVSVLAERLARRTPPEPRLQAQPVDDLHALRAWEHARLHEWEWIDREAGLARIPIERAMALMADAAPPPEEGE